MRMMGAVTIKAEEIQKLGRSGVYLFIDDVNKTFHVTYSSSVKYVVAEFTELCLGDPANSDLELRLLSPVSDIETMLIHTNYYRSRYRNMGYADLSPKARTPVQYRARVLVAPKLNGYDVQLVSKRGSKVITVGRFPNKVEAEDFIETYYGDDNSYALPVYAFNSVTKELLNHIEEQSLYL